MNGHFIWKLCISIFLILIGCIFISIWSSNANANKKPFVIGGIIISTFGIVILGQSIYKHRTEKGDIGVKGPIGDMGPMGDIGLQGTKGDTGLAGQKGPQGPQGNKGPIGKQGPMGEMGPRGDIGDEGDMGLQGLIGEMGSMGEIGPQGAQGRAGSIGLKGLLGIMGPMGIKGERGEKGDIGDIGPVGDEGPQGIMGLVGPIGARGPLGPQGPTGPIGPDGIMGNRGLIGPTGPQGPTGIIGPTGLLGPFGPYGPTGPAGQRGYTGPQGSQGIQGIKGIIGIVGLQGIQGIQGITGPVGLYGTNASEPPDGYPIVVGPAGPVGPRGITPTTNFFFNTLPTGTYTITYNLFPCQGWCIKQGTTTGLTSNMNMKIAPCAAEANWRVVPSWVYTGDRMYTSDSPVRYFYYQGSSVSCVYLWPKGCTTDNGSYTQYATLWPETHPENTYTNTKVYYFGDKNRCAILDGRCGAFIVPDLNGTFTCRYYLHRNVDIGLKDVFCWKFA